MYEVRVEADFCAAHFLQDYHGKCENLHGHNYKVYAHVRGSILDEGGMLLDFTELKAALKTVCDKIDHSNLNDMEYFCQNPSAERIATYIFNEILKLVPSLKKESMQNLSDGIPAFLYAVDVFETDKNRARFIAD